MTEPMPSGSSRPTWKAYKDWQHVIADLLGDEQIADRLYLNTPRGMKPFMAQVERARVHVA